MKKRLRKKLGLGEFRESGFEITWKFTPGIEEAGCDQFLDELLAAVQDKELVFWGGCSLDDISDGIIIKVKRYACTDTADKEFISDWFRSRKDVMEFSVGADVDL
jgi:hypothetical protein